MFYSIKCESKHDTHTSFFINLCSYKCKSFNIRKNNSGLVYLLSLLISASGDVQVNPGPIVSGPVEPGSEVGSIYPCGACESNVTWSRNAVFCEACCIWFHVDCQDIGSSSFQALQDSNVSWHCLNCNAINYHSVSSHFIEDLITSNRFEPISPSEGSSLSHCTFQSDLTSSPGDPVHTSSPKTPVAAAFTTQQTKPKHTTRSIKPIKVLNVNLNSIVAHSADLCNMVDSINPDIIVGVETKIDSSIYMGEILPKQYLENVVRVDRKMGGGGVIRAAKEDCICSEVAELHTKCCIAWMRLEIAGCKPLYICGYYKPSEGDSISLEQFEESLRRLGIVNSHVLIAGDMNFPGYDWENGCLKPNCNYLTLTYQFVDLLDDLSRTQLVTRPTRGNNTLDLVITNNPILVTACRAILGVSDHDAVLTELYI